MKKLAQWTCLLTILILPEQASAQSPDDQAAAVSLRVKTYVEAFNHRDLDGCAEHWSETAEYVTPGAGLRIQGRPAIREALGKLLTTDEQFHLSVADQRFRVVSPDAVLEEGRATLLSERHGIEQAQYLAVHVQRDGQWYRDSVRETVVAANPAAASLQQLGWLIGHLKHENKGVSTDIHGQWLHDESFISRPSEFANQAAPNSVVHKSSAGIPRSAWCGPGPSIQKAVLSKASGTSKASVGWSK